MRARLLTAMLLVAALAIVGFGVPLSLSVQGRYLDEALLRLSAEAARAAVAVPGSFAADNDLPELPEPADDISTALYDTEGQRLLGVGPERADATVEAAMTSVAAQRDRGQLVVALPVSHEEAVVGAVRSSMSVAVVRDRVRRTWGGMALLAAVVLGVAGLVAAQRSRRLTRPLSQLRADAGRLGEGGELPARAPSGIAEIDAVHDALAAASDRLGDAMLRERSFSADAAHQLRTPLASLRLRLETESPGSTGSEALLVDVLHDVDRLEQTITDLLALARDTQRRHEPRPLATLIAERTDFWRPRLVAASRQLDLDLEPQLPFVAESPAAIGQILDVLLDNALTHGRGRVALEARRVGSGAVVAIHDEGTAVLDVHAVFERRAPDAARSGIGLALATRLADAEGLRLVVADPGPGPVFHLVFPGSDQPARTDGSV